MLERPIGGTASDARPEQVRPEALASNDELCQNNGTLSFQALITNVGGKHAAVTHEQSALSLGRRRT